MSDSRLFSVLWAIVFIGMAAYFVYGVTDRDSGMAGAAAMTFLFGAIFCLRGKRKQ